MLCEFVECSRYVILVKCASRFRLKKIKHLLKANVNSVTLCQWLPFRYDKHLNLQHCERILDAKSFFNSFASPLHKSLLINLMVRNK